MRTHQPASSSLRWRLSAHTRASASPSALRFCGSGCISSASLAEAWFEPSPRGARHSNASNAPPLVPSSIVSRLKGSGTSLVRGRSSSSVAWCETVVTATSAPSPKPLLRGT
eukprot:6746505-Prymnesium_polylepis.1